MGNRSTDLKVYEYINRGKFRERTPPTVFENLNGGYDNPSFYPMPACADFNKDGIKDLTIGSFENGFYPFYAETESYDYRLANTLSNPFLSFSGIRPINYDPDPEDDSAPWPSPAYLQYEIYHTLGDVYNDSGVEMIAMVGIPDGQEIKYFGESLGGFFSERPLDQLFENVVALPDLKGSPKYAPFTPYIGFSFAHLNDDPYLDFVTIQDDKFFINNGSKLAENFNDRFISSELLSDFYKVINDDVAIVPTFLKLADRYTMGNMDNTIVVGVTNFSDDPTPSVSEGKIEYFELRKIPQFQPAPARYAPPRKLP